MANIQYVTKNSFIIEARKIRFRVGIFGSIFFLLLIFLTNFIMTDQIVVTASVFLIFGYILVNNISSAGRMERISGKAELNVYKHIKKLSESFVIYNQIEIPSKKSSWGRIELDFMIVCPSGIYIVETKRFKGKIVGANDASWKSVKKDRYGNIYETPQKNPIYQLSYQTDIVREFLNKNEIISSVRGLIYMDKLQKDSELPKNPRYPIFSNKKILKYIQDNEKEFEKGCFNKKGKENYYNMVELFRLVKNKTIT